MTHRHIVRRRAAATKFGDVSNQALQQGAKLFFGLPAGSEVGELALDAGTECRIANARLSFIYRVLLDITRTISSIYGLVKVPLAARPRRGAGCFRSIKAQRASEDRCLLACAVGLQSEDNVSSLASGFNVALAAGIFPDSRSAPPCAGVGRNRARAASRAPWSARGWAAGFAAPRCG